MIQTVNNPIQSVPISDNPSGTFAAFWFQLFSAFTVAINTLIQQAVMGAQSLTDVGQLVKVTAAGTLTEAKYKESDIAPWKASTQANLAGLAATLGTTDSGLLVNVTDYAHVLQWNGTGWQWGPGEFGSGMLQAFAVSPGSGWHACDGSTGIKYLKSDGTTGTVDLPDTTGSSAYMNLGAAYNKTINAATVPTSSTPTFTGSLGNTGAASAGAQPAGTTPSALTLGSHTHTFTPAGTVSAPVISLPGDPVANFEAMLYFRQ